MEDKVIIPEQYRIMLIDELCHLEDDMDRVSYCWKFANKLSWDKSEKLYKNMSEEVRSWVVRYDKLAKLKRDLIDVCHSKESNSDRYKVIEEILLNHRES